VDFADLWSLRSDRGTRAILLYIESVKDARNYVGGARRACSRCW
jgi:acyl-CoA synthetase (NDP forming)